MCHCCKTIRREDIRCGLMVPRAFSWEQKLMVKFHSFCRIIILFPHLAEILECWRAEWGREGGSLRCRRKFPCKYNRNISWSSIVSKPRPYSLGKFFFHFVSQASPIFRIHDDNTQQYAICNFFSPYSWQVWQVKYRDVMKIKNLKSFQNARSLQKINAKPYRDLRRIISFQEVLTWKQNLPTLIGKNIYTER